MMNRGLRPRVSRARQRALQKKRLILGGGALAAALVIALVILLIPKGGGPDPVVEAMAQLTPEPVAEATVEAVPVTPEPTPVPTPEPTPEPLSARAMTRPAAAEGFLPVFDKADTEEKIIAITVDDCFQAENLKQIVDAALAVNGRLTIFPIGKNAVKPEVKEILKYAWENGMELENHTMNHSGLFDVSNEELANQIYMQQMALDYVLDLEYQPHFIRPRGGDARKCQRLHSYARQLGYKGIAHWTVDGKSDNKTLAKKLKPGAIYLFHTTDTDRQKLVQFIPWVVSKGYQLVTLNEMFDYPENETSALTVPVEEHQVPPLEPYEMVYVPLKKTTFCWEAYLVQQALLDLGYSLGDGITAPTGMFGPDSEKAVMAYQRDHGLEETGVADAELVRTLLEGTV